MWSTLAYQRRQRVAAGRATARDVVGGWVALAVRAPLVVVGILYSAGVI
jgi:hypothetical protein